MLSKRFTSNLLFFVTLFPYLTLVNIGTDTQPNAVFLAGIIFIWCLLTQRTKMPKELLSVLLVSLYAISLYLITSRQFYGFRSLTGYLSVFLISFASYKTHKYVEPKVYIFAVHVYLLFGIIQLVYNPSFGGSLLPRSSFSFARGSGVISLTSEPSFYAIMCIFLLILNELFFYTGRYNKRIFIYIRLVLVFQAIITYSGMGLFMLGLYFFIVLIRYFLQSFDKLLSLPILLGIILGIPGLFVHLHLSNVNIPTSTRMAALLNLFIKSPFQIFYIDHSLAARTSHILLSMYSLLYSKGFGLGLGTWPDNIGLLAASAGGFLEEITYIRFTVGRIMSGWGTAVYELGFVGLILPITFWRAAKKGYQNCSCIHLQYWFISSFVIIFIIMLMAISLAHPPFSYLFGVFLHYAYHSDGQ